jgi:hypothetical protein
MVQMLYLLDQTVWKKFLWYAAFRDEKEKPFSRGRRVSTRIVLHRLYYL